ncbi:hypothetical protein [uncultured Aliiroseovarius sp.]|uniref:hypothetical protein n=1 Tax=uncultured Aliiroseovarius sp. TaxID=1658783 RepID=UPI00262960EA|nr:hypothetical protein [uncultured Aliiroseovarius sp.]
MPIRTYAFRIRREAYLLDEDEWSEISPLLENRTRWIQKYRKENGCSLEVAIKEEPIGQMALDTYEAFTGIRLDHPDQLWGVRMCDYGSLCPNCSRPFRTPKAKMCAECGFELPKGMLAGRLGDRGH